MRRGDTRPERWGREDCKVGTQRLGGGYTVLGTGELGVLDTRLERNWFRDTPFSFDLCGGLLQNCQ